MKKYLLIIDIKPEHADEYIEIHRNPWREMLEAIKQAGYTKEAIFFYENKSIIYLECPDDLTHEECDAKLRSTEICRKWDNKLCPWFVSPPVKCAKIFDLEQQLGDGLLPD